MFYEFFSGFMKSQIGDNRDDMIIHCILVVERALPELGGNNTCFSNLQRATPEGTLAHMSLNFKQVPYFLSF